MPYEDQPSQFITGRESSLTEPPRHTMRRWFAQFVQNIDYGRNSGGLEFSYLIMPLPMPSTFDVLIPDDGHDFEERCNFIADTLRDALQAERESSWMRIPGGRDCDSGGGRMVPDSDERVPTFTEYYVHSKAHHRPDGVRLYDRYNAILARHSFHERDGFSDAWLWHLIRPAHRFARLALTKLTPGADWIVSAGLLINDASVPLRFVNEFGNKTDYIIDDESGPLVFGDPPFESQLNDESAVARIINSMRNELYVKYDVRRTT